MANFITAYGIISQQTQELIDQLIMIRARVKARLSGPDPKFQRDMRKLMEDEVESRLQNIGRLVIGLGNERPARFGVALSRLTLNIGDHIDRMTELLCMPGYTGQGKVVLAQLEHLKRAVVYFRRIIVKKSELSTFNINNLVHDAALVSCPYRAEFMPAGHEKTINIVFTEKLDDEMIHMTGDQEAMYLALYHMIENAVLATSYRGGKVNLYTKFFPKLHQMQLTIGDTGEGIDKMGVIKSALAAEVISMKKLAELNEDKKDYNNRAFGLIFEPLVGIFNGKDEVHRGIGLALAKETIDFHKGKIDIHSKEGKGTTFQLFFNLK